MEKVQVKLLDGSGMEFDPGISVHEVAYCIGPRLGKAAAAARVNGEIVDLDYVLEDNCELEIITVDSEEGLEILRHTTAHIMAQAVQRLFDNVSLGIGPTIEDGFYYDFDLDESLSLEDLEKIGEEMQRIIEEDLPVKREVVAREEAIRLMKELGQEYKVELLEELEDPRVSLYRQGEFVDLCRGPHLPSTGMVKAFKLMSIAGAYWRGDEKNKMLQRIYGTAFAKKSELEDYLYRLEEAKKRDHRKLGKELDLYSFHDEAPGIPFFHPRGMVIWNELVSFWREKHRKHGYQEIKTPIILNEELWHRSGHWDNYKENMYFTQVDEQGFAIKPMNCPGGILVYKTKMHSYREFPIRTAELGLVHRHELSGTLHGLLRVRAFTQDDAHIFMLPSQIKDEIIGVIDLVDEMYEVFGFKYHVELSTKPEKAMGSDEIWEKATSALRQALEAKGLDYEVNEGDGAFYGPKIDLHVEDSLGRTWQTCTIQLDFLMPERFDLTYVGSDGNEHRPVMLHRVIYGALERFIGLLVEHYAGAFPVWLAPVQVRVIPVSDEQLDYSRMVAGELKKEGVRVEVDDRLEKMGYKIREAQLEKVPYMLIVGDREVNDGTVAVRDRTEGDLGAVPLEEFKKDIIQKIKERK